jgi:hypothetical protein
LVRDPVTGEYMAGYGWEHRFHLPERHVSVVAGAGQTTEPELNVVYRTRPFTGQTTRYYEVEILSSTSSVDDTGIYTFTTLSGAIAVHNAMFDHVGFTGTEYAQWRSDLSTWLTENGMSANDYYDEYGS